VSTYKAYTGWKAGGEFKAADKKIWLFTMISAHITLLLGLYQVAFGRYGIFTSALPEGTSFMKDKFFRFYWLEHPLLMIVAITLITMGHAAAKKNIPATEKYKKAFYFFVIALVAILAAVPWPFRDIVGRPLLPGM
jgi:hypothetical protein